MFHAKGAYIWRAMLVTLGEEVRRRLRNTDTAHTDSQLLKILKRFSQMLIDSGYDLTSRQEILKSGIRKLYREMAQAMREGNSIYRTRTQMNQKKEIKTLLNKPWFRRIRRGSQLKLVKEGEDKEITRAKVENVEGNQDNRNKEKNKECPKPGKTKEVSV